MHAFLEGKAVHNILVDTSEISFKDYKPPSSLERRGSITWPVKVAAAFTIAPMVTLKIECSTIAEIGRATAEGISTTLKDFIDIMHERTAESLIVE